MKILLHYLKNYKKLIYLALFLAAVNQVFSLLDPYFFRLIIDNYATKFHDYDSDHFFKGVGLLLLGAMSVAFISRVAKNFQDYYINNITQRLGAKIYSDGLAHSLELPYQVFEDQRSGETLGKLQKVRLDVERLISTAINILFTSIVGLIFVIVYSFTVHWVIAPIFLATAPLIGWISSKLSKKIKVIQKNIVTQTNALSGSTTESLRNIELVKSLGLADQEIERLNSTTDKILQLELQKVKYIRKLSFLQGTMVNMLRNLLLLLLLYLIYIGQISFGQFFSLFIYSFFIFGPLQMLGDVVNVYREAEVSLNNFEDIMNMQKEVKPAEPVHIEKINSLEFKDVSFKHLSASTNALNNISFKTGTGKTIAFAGPSGSGKTTLVKLLVGLYKPGSGNIKYNGTNEDQIDFDMLREHIGFVTQDSQLFSGSIRENLLFVNPTATDEQIYDVLNRSACQGLLSRADKGLDTVIGEGGVKVSGGEKQRLSIARALLRKPTMMIFDEATSSLDSITEEEISNTIRAVSASEEHITIMIAHRLSTILHADMIFVLEKGHIIEQGTHEELLGLKGLYYAMWRQQIGEKRSDDQSNGKDQSKAPVQKIKA